MAMLSTNASAQLASGGFKLYDLGAGKVEITDFADDYVFASDGVVEIPATLANTAGDDFQVVGIANYAFSSLDEDLRLKIKGLKINASITYIGAEAFKDLGNLATVTFGTESAASKLEWIGNAAFAKDPMLTSISFANCPKLMYFTSDGEEKTSANYYTTPFVYTVYNDHGTSDTSDDTWDLVPNEKLTTITLNTGTLDFGMVLANVKNLATVNIKETKIRKLNGYALNGNVKIATLELPAKPVYSSETGELTGSLAVVLDDNALAGTAITTLTINGNVAANGVGALGVPMTVGTSSAPSVPSLTTVTFKGEVATNGIKKGAFLDDTKLATVTFVGAVASSAVLAGAFENAGTAATATSGIKMTVTASLAAADAFDIRAFTADDASEPSSKDIYLTLPKATSDPGVYRCKWEAAAAAPDKIYVESNDNTTYYAKFLAGTSNVEISRAKGDVVVYSAYADGANIYMDPLSSADDKFVVAGGQAVIVKVKNTSLLKSDDKGKYIECKGTSNPATMRYKASATTPYNEIGYEKKMTNQDLNAKASSTQTLYAIAKISANGLKWKPISNEGTFYVNDAFYILAAKSASGARVIWLDEEDATAIKNVKAAQAENGAIYNLAGQKVNANYKGVVIKDGKKYIQK